MKRWMLAAALVAMISAWPQPAAAALDTSGYAGTWSNRHFQLRVTHDGHAVAQYGLARWCAPDVPKPCDTISPTGEIEWGGLASLTFTETQPGGLMGRVDWSTTPDGSLVTGEPITLTIRADGAAELGSGDTRAPIRLCGAVSSGQCGF